VRDTRDCFVKNLAVHPALPYQCGGFDGSSCATV